MRRRLNAAQAARQFAGKDVIHNGLTVTGDDPRTLMNRFAGEARGKFALPHSEMRVRPHVIIDAEEEFLRA